MIEQRPQRAREEWLVLITSDHGGPIDSTDHANNRDPEVHTIPFILAAEGVAAGLELGVPTLYDVAPTVLAWMGVPVAPLELSGCDMLELSAEIASLARIEFQFVEIEGIGREAGVVRRDPSDVCEANGHAYVWYSKVSHAAVPHSMSRLRNSGYVATIWYATSEDGGRTWVERGEALGSGVAGAFDSHAVFTPNIFLWDGNYYLFYTGVRPTEAGVFRNNDTTDRTAIGVAISHFVDGPFLRVSEHPALVTASATSAFDSYRVDDAALIAFDFDGDGENECGDVLQGKIARARSPGAVADANGTRCGGGSHRPIPPRERRSPPRSRQPRSVDLGTRRRCRGSRVDQLDDLLCSRRPALQGRRREPATPKRPGTVPSRVFDTVT